MRRSKRARALALVMTEEAWALFDTYAIFMHNRMHRSGLVFSGALAGAIVEFFLLAMGDDILKGKEEVGLDVFRQKFGKVQAIAKRRNLAIPVELLAKDPKDRRPPTPPAKPAGAGGAGENPRQIKIPWPV